MNIRKIVLIFILGIFPSQLFANNFSVNLGINHSWLVYPDIDLLENEFKPSFSIGINSTQEIFKNFDLTYGIRFFNVGRYDELKSNTIEETVDINHKYISLPIKIGYKINNSFIPFINIEPGVQIYSKIDQTNSLVPKENMTITDEMNTFNLFTGIGLKYQFEINQQIFSVSGLINFGLLRVSKDEKFDVTTGSSRGWADWRTREILINFGYYFGT
jgi:outer membrane protein with beta-barrel domain